MAKPKVYGRKCEDCDKEITSLSEQQFKYNWEQHKEAHKRKENV